MSASEKQDQGAAARQSPAGRSPAAWLTPDAQAARLEASGLFDADWYLARHAWGGAPPASAALHYLTEGGFRGLRPNPLFDSALYLSTYADVRDSGMNPLLHYLMSGAAEGRRASALFTAPRDPQAAAGGETALARYLREVRGPHPLFDPRWYLERHPTVARRGANPLWHYLSEGEREGLRPHPLFDPAWYLRQRPDALAAGGTALEHYLLVGWREGCSPHPLFDGAWYLALYADVAAAGLEPLEHFLAGGAADGRQPHPLFDGIWYAAQRPAGLAPGGNPLLHYLARGAAAGVRPGPEFDSDWYLGSYPEAAQAGISPLEHYVTLGKDKGHLRLPPSRRAATGARAGGPWRPPEDQAPGVNLIGPVTSVNGLGTSARGYLAGLQASGCRVNVVPWERDFDGSAKLPGLDFPGDGPQPVNLVHLNLDLLTQSRLLQTPALRAQLRPGSYNILVPYWELAALAPEWAATIAAFDEIWCASSFMARAFHAVTPRPVRVVRPAIGLPGPSGERTRASFGLPPGRFLFAYLADASSVLGRKNPLAFARAYVESFAVEEGAACLLKLGYAPASHPDLDAIRALAAERPDVILLERTLAPAELADLYHLIDCYVSPHRSEGLGLTVIEAMAAGRPVIATGYGGVEDFVTPRTSLVLPHRLVEVGPGNAPYRPRCVWADPLPADLRAALRQAFAEPDLVAARAARGQALVESLFSPRQTGAVLAQELERIWAGRPA